MRRLLLSGLLTLLAVGLSAQKIQNPPPPPPKPITGGGGATKGTTCPSQSLSVGDLTLQIRGNEGAYPFPPPPIVNAQTQCENGIPVLHSLQAPTVNPISATLLELEHMISADAHGDPFSKTGQFGDYFTPRFGTYTTYRDGPSTVRIVRLSQNDPHGLGYTMIYDVFNPNIIDVSFSVTPTTTDWLQTPYGNYLLVFGANYTAPLATAQPPGVFVEGANGWQWFTFPSVNGLAGSPYGCALRALGTPALTFDPASPAPWNYCSYNTADSQYAQPTMVQQFPGGMELQWIFDRSDSQTDRLFLFGMEFFASQNRLPADYGYIVNHPVAGQTYGYRGRMIYGPSSGPAQWTQNRLDAQAVWSGQVWP